MDDWRPGIEQEARDLSYECELLEPFFRQKASHGGKARGLVVCADRHELYRYRDAALSMAHDDPAGWRASTREIGFLSGARLRIDELPTIQDIQRFIGHEFTFIAVGQQVDPEQASQQVQYFRSMLRNCWGIEGVIVPAIEEYDPHTDTSYPEPELVGQELVEAIEERQERDQEEEMMAQMSGQRRQSDTDIARRQEQYGSD